MRNGGHTEKGTFGVDPEVPFSCLFLAGVKEQEEGEAMKKEEFVALGIIEDLAVNAEAASLKELEGYVPKCDFVNIFMRR